MKEVCRGMIRLIDDMVDSARSADMRKESDWK